MQREPRMILVRNAHTAMVAKIAPGAVGQVDAANPGTAAQLRAGLLQPVRDDGLVLPSTDEGTVPSAELRAAVAEIDRLRSENAALRAKLDEATRPQPPADTDEPAPSPPAASDAPKPPKAAKVTREG